MRRIEIEIEQRLGFGEVRELVRACLAGREEDGVTFGYFLLAFRRAEQTLSAEDEETFFVKRVVVVGEASFLRRQLNERGKTAFRFLAGDEADFLVIIHVVIGSTCPDGVRGIGVADDGHGYFLLASNGFIYIKK